jgi:hypothetical protein
MSLIFMSKKGRTNMTLTGQQMGDREERQRKRRMLRLSIGCAVVLFVFALIVFAYFFAK